ncbi:Nramp family divalent metal transporter [Lacticaseibacillus parakribbianus]|uniref:Nramp family divalent metal transporter n=1 Tax=Lacticaseibacillus parakribbianus TaxID=2970927 RepID=UPI0021CB715C|nr:Nramp family divalent metal transporter [Lacticaseibacillus parakribbianus]
MMQNTVTPTENKQSTTGTKVKTFLRNIGPAVITVFSWLGAGDIINSAVSGASYGYALMWVLILSNLIRFVIVNTMTRYELMNKDGKSMVATFAEITKIFPLFLFIASVIMGNLTVGYILKGAAQCFGWLINVPAETLWAAVIGVIAFLLLGRSLFGKVESIFKILMAVLVSVFIILAIYVKPDVGQIAQGAFLFQIPNDDGAYDVMLVIMGLVGATAGSLGNLFHGINLSEGGVRDPKTMKSQTKSLLFSVIMGALLVLCVWIVGAEILRPNGIQVKSLSDIGKALEMYLGTTGSKIFYLGVFGALFTSTAGNAIGFTKLAIANLNELIPSRKGKYDKIQNDKIYPIFLGLMLASAFIWSLPHMPGQVFLTLFGNSLNVVIVPIIALGVLYVTNSKKFLGTARRNNWFENIVLGATTILALVTVFKGFL